MSTLQRAVASLRITGEDLDPDHISALLGSKPSRSGRKGDDPRPRHDPNRPVAPARLGFWAKHATPTEPEDLDAQVLELLNALPTDLAMWRSLCARYRVSIFCGWFMSQRNAGVEISSSTLLALGERGIRLDLDIYAPDDEA